MSKRTVIPFGPQHPVLPEPIHLDLVMEDEKVVEALPSIGFVHRGLEKMCEVHDYEKMVYVAERICGICSFIHGLGYCQAIEKLMDIEVPPRAVYLRVFWSELSRIHSHLLWLGLFADAFGFESLFMHCWRIRERIVEVIDETAGGRIIFGSCKIGGARRDVSAEQLQRIGAELKEVEAECRKVIEVFRNDTSVKKRTVGLGVMSRDEAHSLGAVGPVGRGSGLEIDARKLGYACYNDLSWDIPIYTDGDCYARCLVRLEEVYQAFSLLHQVIAKIPDGPVDVKYRGSPKGDFMSRLEQPRGEVCYYLKGNGKKNLERFRVRTPTFANLAPLVHMLKNVELADVPVIILTIDPCISCAER